VTASDAAEGILDTAEAHQVDLIVTATHGRRGLARALLGSVTEGVLNAARTSVLTVPRRARTGRAALSSRHVGAAARR
jgi:nucleotide-binding universal stress UspA family protein